jgi:hypothetical protein
MDLDSCQMSPYVSDATEIYPMPTLAQQVLEHAAGLSEGAPLAAKLPASELMDVALRRSRLPTWMAQEISVLVTHD